VNTTLLEQELAPLNAQIEQVQKKRETLEGELRVVEAELEKFSAARQRVDALRDVCDALARLGELKAGELFWKGIPGSEDAVGHLARARGRVERFEGQINGILEKQASFQAQISQCVDELDILYEEVRDAHDREEQRKMEFVIEREISEVPYRVMIMPWTKEAESERQFRRAVLVALLFCFVFGALIPLVKVPLPDKSVVKTVIPERLAMLVKKEPPIPAPHRKPLPKKPSEEPQEPQKEAKPQHKSGKANQSPKGGGGPAPKPTKLAGGGGGAGAARKRAERMGVLAFKKSFAGLMGETSVARLGTEARLSKASPRVAGQAVAQRSLVAIQAQDGASGGIGYARVSRNIGYGNVDRLGGGGIGRGGGSGDGTGVGFARVTSTIASSGGGSDRPLSNGPGPGRTDEEIQIVFDRYKAALYRIYNKELRKDPTLRGKILLRICIERSGAVSFCKVVSTDLGSPALVAQIVERIKLFNFGPKDGVPKTVILYPIDFLPAA
jgi:outer membrane biosynthesis protein TonB